jgi:hypothetical protein
VLGTVNGIGDLAASVIVRGALDGGFPGHGFHVRGWGHGRGRRGHIPGAVRVAMSLENLAARLDDLSRNREALSLLILQGSGRSRS